MSATANILAIIGLVEKVVKVLNRVRHEPGELDALVNELSDITIVLRGFESVLQEQGKYQDLPQVTSNGLSTLLLRAKAKLEVLGLYLQSHAAQAQSALSGIVAGRLR